MTEANHSGDAANMVGQPLTDEQIESLAVNGNDADGLMQAAGLVNTVASSESRGEALAAIFKYRKDCRVDAIKRTLSAVRAQGDGWLPIESAPRDGTPVLLLTANGQIEGYWSRGEWTQDVIYCTYDGCGGPAFECRPTAWQPLPPPPNAKGAKQ